MNGRELKFLLGYLVGVVLISLGVSFNFVGEGMIDKLATLIIFTFIYIPLILPFYHSRQTRSSVHRARIHLGPHVKHLTDQELKEHLR